MKRSRIINRLPLVLIAAVFLRADSCGTEILHDPSFDLWCGDTLCHWKVESGSIKKVPTWHKSDYGVELDGNPAVLSQVSDIDSSTSCLSFDMITNVDADATLLLQLDFFNDGSIDYTQQLPTAAWHPFEEKLALPTFYAGVRFILRKEGSGRAVAAQMQVEGAHDCPGAPIVIKSLPVGAPCDQSDHCASQLCSAPAPDLPLGSSTTCGECGSDADCLPNEVCGVAADPGFYLHAACVMPNHVELGQSCRADAECSTGICCHNVCSTCCSVGDCAAGQKCDLDPVWSFDPPLITAPHTCLESSGLSAAGDPCMMDRDCQSGSCSGSTRVHACAGDNRPCKTDDDCPSSSYGCVSMGFSDGSCD